MNAFAKTNLKSKEGIAVFLLISSYLFGSVMLGHNLIDGFVYLTAPHLVMSAFLLVLTHKPKPSNNLWVWLLLCFFLGYWAEYVGVHQGWLFGDYVYGDVLGPKLWGIPVIIGVNWILVVYAICSSINHFGYAIPKALKIFLAAVGLVMLDVLIEPVAIALDMWTWTLGHPPLQNYIGWFAVSLIQATLFFMLIPVTENRIGTLLLLLQIFFFGYLNFSL